MGMTWKGMGAPGICFAQEGICPGVARRAESQEVGGEMSFRISKSP